MRRYLSSLLLALLLCFVVVQASLVQASEGGAEMLQGVEHWRQSTIRVAGAKVVYFDPYKVETEPHDGDVIFVTHTHGDHLSVADLKKVMKPGATVVVPADGEAKLRVEGIATIVTVAPGQSLQVEGVNFETIPAYNTNKAYHPKASNWVGYVVHLNNLAMYVAGDTDVIPEMKELRIDVAFLPIGGKYTMTAKEAAEAANLIKPSVAVPIHFADVVGSWDDAELFLSLLDKGITGAVLKKR